MNRLGQERWVHRALAPSPLEYAADLWGIAQRSNLKVDKEKCEDLTEWIRLLSYPRWKSLPGWANQSNRVRICRKPMPREPTSEWDRPAELLMDLSNVCRTCPQRQCSTSRNIWWSYRSVDSVTPICYCKIEAKETKHVSCSWFFILVKRVPEVGIQKEKQQHQCCQNKPAMNDLQINDDIDEVCWEDRFFLPCSIWICTAESGWSSLQ